MYDTGKKLYVQLPDAASAGEMPALMVMRGRKEVLVNYRIKPGNTMEVDGVFDHVILVAGVGNDQERIDIWKKGARPRGNAGYFPAIHDETGGR